MPTFSALVIVIAKASALSSIPVDLKEVRVPTLVIFGCAAVAHVPVIATVTPSVQLRSMFSPLSIVIALALAELLIPVIPSFPIFVNAI